VLRLSVARLVPKFIRVPGNQAVDSRTAGYQAKHFPDILIADALHPDILIF
jgi:hypothetical protein